MNKKILKLTLMLGLVASLATIAVAAVNTVTAPVIEENLRIAFENTVREMFPTGSVGEIYYDTDAPTNRVIRIVEGASTIGFIYEQSVGGFNGTILYLVAVDADGYFIAFSTLSHSETTGIGDVIDSLGWEERMVGTHATTPVDTHAGATGTTSSVQGSLLTIYDDLQNRR